jgi:hypothetical protein
MHSLLPHVQRTAQPEVHVDEYTPGTMPHPKQDGQHVGFQ